ncbi:MAG: ABC transporter substrate-binding protein, partial [Nocardioides sp.]|nr:ABC transporter substrate-binding protein [Nocardioides sp.]
MTIRPRTRLTRRSPRQTTLAGLAVVASFALAACGSADAASGPKLAADAPLPTKVPAGTTIRIGDPAVQVALQTSGLDKQLKDAGVKVEWANISGGPDSIKAFRGNKLDCSSVADIPSLFAHWTGTDTKIVFNSVTVDPLAHPTYKLGIAPGANIKTLADLKGKKIAYSAGQAQGALVLRVLAKAGLTQKDVKLVDLPSTASTYAQALTSKAVDAAPLGTATIQSTYLGPTKGGTAIDTGIRDDAATLYCLSSAVENKAQAAALAVYVKARTEALLWENDNPEKWKVAYYEKNQGLTPAQADQAIKTGGDDAI